MCAESISGISDMPVVAADLAFIDGKLQGHLTAHCPQAPYIVDEYGRDGKLVPETTKMFSLVAMKIAENSTRKLT